MRTERIELEYEGETYEYTIDKWIQCEHCGYRWESASEMERPTCPDCSRKTDREYVDSYHFYIKMAWWFENPNPSVRQHTEALRYTANRLEALEANGWEMVRSDGEHVYFQREREEQWDDENPFKQTDTLE